MIAERNERLVDRIYDAVVEPSAWLDVLAGLVELSGADQAMLLTASVITGASDARFFGNDSPSAPAEFQTYYSAINPLTRMVDPVTYLARWRPTIIRDEDIMARAALEHTEYYNDFLKPLGAHHGMYMRLNRRDATVTNVSLGRDLKRGRFEENSMAALAPVYLHLKRATALRRRFDGLSQFADAATAALDAAVEPMLMIDANARVVHANAAADRLLASGTLLRVIGGRLVAAHPRAAVDLANAISQATEPHSRRGDALALTDLEGRRAAEASVLPVALHEAVKTADGPAVLIRVNPLADPVRLEEVMDQYALTRAERVLAVALVDGQSLRQISASRGVSVNTLRCQLAGLFDKTGARRQVELVTILRRAIDR